MDNNSKTTSPQLSYGVLVVFQIDKTWGVGLGAIHNELEKSTMGVLIDPNGLNSNYKGTAYADNTNYVSFSNKFSGPEEIILQEKLSYLEVPVDISYTIWRSGNLGLDAIGGIGVQKLTKNEIIYIRSSGESEVLGENRTYSKGSFDMHLGLGLDYRISQVFQLHLEPMFRPQIGFYEDNIGDHPFIVNVHFGLKYKL